MINFDFFRSPLLMKWSNGLTAIKKETIEGLKEGIDQFPLVLPLVLEVAF